ncbi:cx9C motif-containing protein 4 isoform X3 [Carcharodon carcharias]|nr:cx9C motif-containing protein 4 isoform X3 [Carcharodon carcharias]
MSTKDPCQKQACEIQKCLQGLIGKMIEQTLVIFLKPAPQAFRQNSHKINYNGLDTVSGWPKSVSPPGPVFLTLKWPTFQGWTKKTLQRYSEALLEARQHSN